MINHVKSIDRNFLFPRADYSRSVGFLNRKYIQCITCGPVVYVRTLKCASTFFYNSLRYEHRWEEINYNDINWDQQYVFGHILEPIARRHKGIAEYVDMLGLQDDFLSNTNLQKLIATQPALDMHSVSLSQYYGKHMWLIDWIPLSDNNHKTIVDTEKLLTYTCQIKYFRWKYDNVHSSTPEKKNIELKIKELWNEHEISNLIHPLTWAYFAEDLALYNKVMELYNPTGTTWDQMSWLRHREQWVDE